MSTPGAASGRDDELLVTGSGPGGQKAATAAADLGRRVGVVGRRDTVGGVRTRNRPTLREASTVAALDAVTTVRALERFA